MSNNNPTPPNDPPAPQSAATMPTPIPAILRGPIALKIHNLDDSTSMSAVAEATEALQKVEGKVVKVRGEDVTIDTALFEVGQGNPTAGDRRNHSATIRFRPDLYHSINDMPDESLLSRVGDELDDLGYCVRWSGSANNDRNTVLNFEWRFDTSSNNTPLPLDDEAVKNGMAAMLGQLRIKPTKVMDIDIDGTSVQGRIGFTNPTTTDMLVNKGTLIFTDCRAAHAHTPNELRPRFKVAFYPHDRYIHVSECTTLCLYVAGCVESDAEFEADAKRIMAKVAEK